MATVCTTCFDVNDLCVRRIMPLCDLCDSHNKHRLVP